MCNSGFSRSSSASAAAVTVAAIRLLGESCWTVVWYTIAAKRMGQSASQVRQQYQQRQRQQSAAGGGGAPVIGPLWLDITQPPTRTPFPPSTNSPPAFFTAASGAKRGLASEMPIGARRVFHYRCSRRHHCAVYNSPSASTVPPVNFMSALHSCQTKPGLWAPCSPPDRS